MNQRALTTALLLLGWVAGLGCVVQGRAPDEPLSPPPSDVRVTVADGWLAMGTFFEADLRVAPGDVSSARRWLDWARAEIARLEAVCSRHDPASALSTLNHALASPVSTRSGLRVAPALEAFLSAARAVWKASGGAFDPTVGPLVEVWRSAALEGVWPSDQAIERARQRVGSEQILPGGGGSLNVTTEGLQLDLDGLSKGFVLDRLRARLVAELPEASALIHFGQSSVMAIGDPDGRRSGGGWRLAVHSRGDSPRRLVTVALRDKALSVSSSVGRINRIGGEPVSHVVDPRTGRPVDGEVEAVVIADRGDRADGWSTALLVLGARSESVRLAERAGVAAFVFESADRVRTTFDWDGFEAR